MTCEHIYITTHTEVFCYVHIARKQSILISIFHTLNIGLCSHCVKRVVIQYCITRVFICYAHVIHVLSACV